MATLTSLRELVRREVPGCPGADMDFYWLRMARSFCDQTWAWCRSIDLQLVANERFYPLSAIIPDPANEEVVSIKAVEWKGVPINPARQEDLKSSPGAMTGWFFNEQDEFWPIPWPDDNTDVSVKPLLRIVFRPRQDAVTVADDFVKPYGEIVAHGVIARILEMPQRPWTDVAEADRHLRMFTGGMLRAKSKAMGGDQPWNLRAHARGFAVR